MKAIFLICLGFVFALISGYLNPMNWPENYKGSITLSIYFFNALLVGGLLLAGIGIEKTINNMRTT